MSHRVSAVLGLLLVVACGGGSNDGGGGGPSPTGVASVTILPGSASLTPGRATQFTATVKDAAGATLDSAVTWSSDSSAVASVSSDGLVVGRGAGTTLVIASSGAKSDTATVTVTLESSGWVEVATGDQTTCARTGAGIAYCWGYNDLGTLGNGSSGNQTFDSPQLTTGGHVFATLTAKFVHVCGLSGVTTYCWGYNSSGQLGVSVSAVDHRSSPVVVSGGQAFASVTAGGLHTCALTSDGAAFCWGRNNWGQLGNGASSTGAIPTPVAVLGGHTFVQLALGDSHTCGRTPANIVYCWGLGFQGQLGVASLVGVTQANPIPLVAANAQSFSSIIAGIDHTCGLTDAGAALCWGDNFFGQLGTALNNGSLTGVAAPQAVSGGHRFLSLTAGSFHSCGLTSNGAAWCWGYNQYGQLGTSTGNGTDTPVPAPEQVTGGRTFSALSAGGNATCGLTSTGQLACWGSNLYGQLATATNSGTMAANPTPVLIALP